MVQKVKLLCSVQYDSLQYAGTPESNVTNNEQCRPSLPEEIKPEHTA